MTRRHLWSPLLPKRQQLIQNARQLCKARLLKPDVSACIAADIIFVSVNTPTKTSGIGAGKAADLSYWESAARVIAHACKGPELQSCSGEVHGPSQQTAEAIAKASSVTDSVLARVCVLI